MHISIIVTLIHVIEHFKEHWHRAITRKHSMVKQNILSGRANVRLGSKNTLNIINRFRYSFICQGTSTRS